MAQLININSTEFRRCNLSAIQSGGTWESLVPDENEIILISTTNALTAGGSGECDAYIKGDGTTLASALELKQINPGLYTTGETYTSVDFSSLTTKNKYINANNVWSLGSTTYNISYLVPVDGATKVRVTSNTIQGAIIAFLKSETPYYEAVDFSAEQPARIRLEVGTTQEFDIPSDCNLVYVFVKTDKYDFLPSPLELLKESSVSRFDVIQTQIEELSTQVESIDAEVESIDTDAITQLELQINGGNEDVLLTFGRGYAQMRGDSTIVQIITNSTNRVLSSVLKGSYNIKTNAGYVIRGVTAWNGGAATEGKLPTENITGVTNCTNLVTQATLTEYNCDGTYEYTIITFCKTNASATISPSEDIVESCTKAVAGIEQRVQDLEASGGAYRVVRKALFMGDSINYGLASYFNGTKSGVREVTNNRISDYFAQMTGAQVDNIAARGTGYVADTRNLGNGWVKAQNTDFSTYNLVCICLGINDYIQHVSIGTLIDNTQGTLIGNMTRIINKIMTDNPLCKVVIFSPYNSWGQVCDDSGSEYQIADYYGDESTDYALGYAISGHTLTEYITAIDSVCAAYHIQHVKLSESGMINKANIKKVLADGLHPIVDVRPMLAAELFGRKVYD